MNASLEERYQAGDSPLHRLDPRVKVVTALALIVGILLTSERAWPAYPLLWALLGSLAAIGGLGAGRVARMGGLALPFALAALILIFTTPGKPVVIVAGLTATDAGLARFVAVALKNWLAAQAALLLSMSTHFTDLLWALGSLRTPATLVAIIGFMYRYLFTLKDEADRLIRARAARSGAAAGQKAGGSLVLRAQVAGGMIGNLFLRSYARSERIYAAMLARGYSGEIVKPKPPPLTWRTVWQGAVPVLALAVIEILALLWWGNP